MVLPMGSSSRLQKNTGDSDAIHLTAFHAIKALSPGLQEKCSAQRMPVRRESQPVDAHILLARAQVQPGAYPFQMGTPAHLLDPWQSDSFP